MKIKYCLSGFLLVLLAAQAARAGLPEKLSPPPEYGEIEEKERSPQKLPRVETRDWIGENLPNSYYPQLLSAEFSPAFTDEGKSPEDKSPLEAAPPSAAISEIIEPRSATEAEAPAANPAADAAPTAPQPLDAFSLDPDAESAADDGMAQVSSVSQLSDVQPTDWAYQALQNLVERYNCIAGYPDGTFRGNRAMTRYEFAAGLNACLEYVNQLIKQQGNPSKNLITREDLATVQRLTEQFQVELATLRGRIDSLEARTTTLESQQFTSSTTLFGGEVVFALADATGGNPPGAGSTNTVFNHLVRLQTVSTFSGKDLLRLELGTGNFDDRGFGNQNSLGTDMALLSYQAGLNNRIALNLLEYRFPAFGDRVVFTIRPVGFSLSSVLTANSPYFDTGRGALSRFAEASPLFKIGALDAGVGFDWLISDRARLQVAYGTRDANNPDASLERQGFLGASHSAWGVQLLTKPVNKVLTGISYINAYASDGRLDTFTGSLNADISGELNEPAQFHGISGTLQWRAARNLTFGTWGGVIFTDSKVSDASATTTTYLFSLGLSDPFGRKGDLLAFLAGQPPKLRSGEGVTEDPDTALHLEAFYRLRLTDRITITPGLFYIINPEHNADNDDILVGVLRSSFRF